MVEGTDSTLKLEAEKLSKRLGLKIGPDMGKCDFALILKQDRLEIQRAEILDRIWVDFTQGKIQYRRLYGKKQMLYRAIGIKKGNRPTVLDCTGGFGRDSFLLASAGCRVTILERNKIIAALLEDGLKRARENPETTRIIENIEMFEYDAVSFLTEMAKSEKKYDVVYLDPMFPASSKSAKVKKELQFLQLLNINDNNIENLLPASLKVAGKRVVVKRPKHADFMNALTPSYNLSGRTTRFDVYISI